MFVETMRGVGLVFTSLNEESTIVTVIDEDGLVVPGFLILLTNILKDWKAATDPIDDLTLRSTLIPFEIDEVL